MHGLASAIVVLVLSPCAIAETIEVPMFRGGEGLSFFLSCARAYEEARPGVKVNLYGDPRIDSKIRIRILDGTFPELTNAWLHHDVLIGKGVYYPLGAVLDGPSWEGDRTWRQSFLPGTLEIYTVDGETYGIPFSYYVNLMWFNKGMFREHGWKPPATWEEWFDLCEAISRTGIAPIAFQGRYYAYASMITNAACYQVAGPEALERLNRLDPGAIDNPEFVRALELVQRLATRYFQNGCMGMSHTEAQLQFFLSKAAMIPCGTWLKSEMDGKIPEGFELGAFNFPAVEGGKGDPTAIGSESNYFVIFRDSPNPAGAADFLRFMTSREMAGQFARERDMPVAIRGANEGNLSPALADVERIIADARAVYNVDPKRLYPEYGTWWVDELYHLLTGSRSPGEVAAALETAAGTLREKARNPDRVLYRSLWQPILLLVLLGLAVLYVLGTQARRLLRPDPRSAPVAHSTLRLRWKKVLLFVLPALIPYLVFVVVPAVRAFSLCVMEWDGLTGARYIGLLHFRRLLFENEFFWVSFRNNLFLMFVPSLFVLPLALFLAVCLSRRVKGAGLFRVIFFFPNILGVVAATLLWMHVYNPQGGLMNGILVRIGEILAAVPLLGFASRWFLAFDGFPWLAPDRLYWSLIPISLWGGVGFFMILFLAAMEGVPRPLYEAAEMDGAGPWRQFRAITFPLIWEVVSIALVFTIIGGMKAFETIWLLTNQMPTSQNSVLGTMLVTDLFNGFKAGQATAIGVILFLVVFFGTVATVRMMRRDPVEL